MAGSRGTFARIHGDLRESNPRPLDSVPGNEPARWRDGRSGPIHRGRALVLQGYEGLKNAGTRSQCHSGPDSPRRPVACRDFMSRRGKPDQAAAWKTRLGIPDLPADVFAPSRECSIDDPLGRDVSPPRQTEAIGDRRWLTDT